MSAHSDVYEQIAQIDSSQPTDSIVHGNNESSNWSLRYTAIQLQSINERKCKLHGTGKFAQNRE